VGKRCRALGLGWAAPKPFCSLQPGRHPAIDRFMEYFRVGFPQLEVTVKDGLIREARVLRSAPCGNTYYVAFNLPGAKADASVIERVAKYWHSFPCVASMEMDNELRDTILHLKRLPSLRSHPGGARPSRGNYRGSPLQALSACP